jgi:intergrase/recombinase
MQRHEAVELWKSAREKTGLNITHQKLRQWFCSEMLKLGVSETYVDAFCGRVPKSVLARHYADFSPEKLKEIYGETKPNVLRLLAEKIEMGIIVHRGLLCISL